jgi:hypothetical protein
MFPTGGMDVCCECCVLSLRRTDHSSRGILPNVARHCVWSRKLENEEAKARYGAVKNTSTKGYNAKKTNKQTVNILKVSGSFFVHQQEIKTLHTASSICQACLLIPLAWVTYTRCCVYSFELLMMGGIPALNMYSIDSNKEYCVTLHLVGYT